MKCKEVRFQNPYIEKKMKCKEVSFQNPYIEKKNLMLKNFLTFHFFFKVRILKPSISCVFNVHFIYFFSM